MRGTLRRGSFTGDPANMLSKALEMDVSTGARFWGKMEGRFPNFFLLRGIFIRNLR